MDWIEEIGVGSETEPDWEDWCNAVARNFVVWVEEDLRRLWLVIEQYADDLALLLPWLDLIAGLFPPRGMDWQMWVSLLIETDGYWLTAAPEMFEEERAKATVVGRSLAGQVVTQLRMPI